MKRIFTFIAAFSMIMAALAQTPGITVSHKEADGTETLQFFSSTKLGDAIAAADDGDIIYLSAGKYDVRMPEEYTGAYYDFDVTSFSSYPVLKKALTFIGAGGYWNESGKVNGTYINFNNDLVIDLSKSNCADGNKVISFEGLCIPNNIRIASDLNKLTFRNSAISDLGLFKDENGAGSQNIDNLVVDRCKLNNINLRSNYCSSANINNTKIRGYARGECGDGPAAFSLSHCFVGAIDTDFIGYILNSIIYSDNATSAATTKNCIYGNTNSVTSTQLNCILGYKGYNDDSDPSWQENTTYKAPTGYRTTDDTLFGSLGGSTPYSLYPGYPTPDGSATSLVITYDEGSPVLKVTVAILGEGE